MRPAHPLYYPVHLSARLETHVEALHRVGERTYRHVVYATLCIGAYGVEGDTAR